MAKKRQGSSKGAKGGQWADHLTQRAKAENYPARSVYKLEEIQKKFKVMGAGDKVLDLGCAPGSWLIYASRQVGKQGRVFGIDLKEIQIPLPENVTAVQDNILSLEDPGFLEEISGCRVVLSDMAPATTGRKDVDALRSSELCRMALETAQKILGPKGNFVCKIFQGNEFKAFEKEVKKSFRECRIFKPESCRKQSKEIYIIAKGKK
ncbi:RlmE family RNA methyltransferase [Desulfospira joergensenii]|uniref:RlmE family RNA methyltransferase n=1 Tax=Desulfospira joergensenii TaxID=53329 RepID=UPI0003B39DDD|nr:RlmE family RNA methyltransferase [Desulfospira joergensenii]